MSRRTNQDSDIQTPVLSLHINQGELMQRIQRRGAAGKAFLVYLGSGSVIAALVAYFAFAGMGC